MRPISISNDCIDVSADASLLLELTEFRPTCRHHESFFETVMAYDFSSLSHSEFEDLARDLVGREIELRFEAFPEGPDDGMDGRHARADGSVVM